MQNVSSTDSLRLRFSFNLRISQLGSLEFKLTQISVENKTLLPMSRVHSLELDCAPIPSASKPSSASSLCLCPSPSWSLIVPSKWKQTEDHRKTKQNDESRLTFRNRTSCLEQSPTSSTPLVLLSRAMVFGLLSILAFSLLISNNWASLSYGIKHYPKPNWSTRISFIGRGLYFFILAQSFSKWSRSMWHG